MLRPFSLRTLSFVWVGLALITGVVASYFWVQSNRLWDRHLANAYVAGIETYHALLTQNDVRGVSVGSLTPADADHATQGNFTAITGTPKPGYLTLLTLKDTSQDGALKIRSEIHIAVVSDQLSYPISELPLSRQEPSAYQFGALTQLMATYCSNPIIFARVDQLAWVRVDGSAVWGCAAAPSDDRLWVAIVSIVLISMLGTHIANTTDAFGYFARALKSRQLVGGPDSYETKGPKELLEIVGAVNDYLQFERDQLSNRAIVLSGVSHDLGTPATRLRLRAALIQDDDIRKKLDSDIDLMTATIEGVLTYTRSESNSEQPQKIDLMSLIDAIVADYQDTGAPVTLRQNKASEINATQQVFSTRKGTVPVSEAKAILSYVRPVSLRRAITNLIDNAIKYGRKASVTLQADANHIYILVEDAGGPNRAAEMDDYLAPFKRGSGAQSISGFGLGLTIVATVARQHGGTIEFQDGRTGVLARLVIKRIL
jgi:two-component system osmolarity sensor histidine kinase EnvZ